MNIPTTTRINRVSKMFFLLLTALILPILGIAEGLESPPALHCIGPSQISLDQTGRAILMPADFIRSGDISNAILLVDDVRRDTMFCADAGQQFMITVRDTVTGQSCWTTLTVEDKLDPIITCDTVFMTCQMDVEPLVVPDSTRSFFDNCAEPPSISFVDSRVDFDCDNDTYTSQVTRLYTVTDDFGNSATCEQVILFERLSVADVDFPSDTMIACPVMDTLPSTTGAPNIDGMPLNMACGIVAWYNDVLPDPGCDGELKIIREWMIMDWCSDPPEMRSATQRIDIIDTVPPVIICPMNDSLITDSDICATSYRLPMISATDECSSVTSFEVDINTVMGTFAVGETVELPEGENIITYTVTDDCDNPATCSYVITVIDRIAPNINCATPEVHLGADGMAFFNVSDFSIDVMDNCDPDPVTQVRRMESICGDPNATILGDTVKFCCADIGNPVMVEFVVTDDAGNQNTCMAVVDVLDKIAPVISCPDDVTVDCGTSMDTTLTGTATAIDNCDPNPVITFRDMDMPEECNGMMPFVRRFYAEDASGNIDSCEQMIFIIDTLPPTITCPVDVTVFAPADTIVSVTGNATGSDLCADILTYTYTDNVIPTDCPTEFGVERTWTATDQCMNSASCIQMITVEDTSTLVLTVPADQTETSCQTQAEIDAAFMTWLNQASVSGGVGTILTNNNSGAPDECGGTTVVTWTVTSDCQEPVLDSARFTVMDAPPVVLTVPEDELITSCQTQAMVDDAFIAWLGEATVSGGCNDTLINNNAGAPDACGGTTTVTWTVDSSCEPPVLDSATFVVEDAPRVVLTVPNDTTVSSCLTLLELDNAFNNWLDAAMSGGCNPVITNDNSGSPDRCGGSTLVTWTVTSDCEGPMASSAMFTVEEAPEIVLTVPADEREPSCQSQVDIDAAFTVWLNSASFTGGCDGDLTNNGTVAPDACGGTTTVVWTVDSSCEPPVLDSATFTVENAPPVVLTVPADTTVSSCTDQTVIDAAFTAWVEGVTSSGGCNTVVTDNAINAPDACGGNVTVLWTATSDCEAPVLDSAVFTVENAPPVILTVPADTMVLACTDQSVIDVAFDAWLNGFDVSGGCGTDVTDNSGNAPDACGGSVTVTWTATSDCEAPVLDSAVFTVENAPPVILTVPADTMVSACTDQSVIDAAFDAWLDGFDVSGGCGTDVTDNSGNAPDACGGSVTVTWTATSDCQGPVLDSAVFTVEDAPVVILTVPADTTVSTCQDQMAIDAAFDAWVSGFDVSGGCGTTVTNNAGSAPDACGGNVTVTWTAISDCQAPVLDSAVFTVLDAPPVVLTAPADTTVNSCMDQAAVDAAFDAWVDSFELSGGCGTEVRDDATTPPDACGGSVTVTWTAVSDCESDVTATAVFTVDAPDELVITCPADTSVICGTDTSPDSLGIPEIVGGCPDPIISFSDEIIPGMGDTIETIIRTWRVEGDCMQEDSCDQTIVILNGELMIICPPDITMDADPDSCNAFVDVPAPTVSGNCTDVTISNDQNNMEEPDGIYPVGTTEVTYTVTDDVGLSVSCTFTINVEDNQAPIIRCPADINQSADTGECSALVNTGFPFISENCRLESVSNSFNNTTDATDNYPVGTTVVIWTATDDSGNSSTCSFSVTVTDDENPMITCPVDVVVNADDDMCGADVDIDLPVTSDNCAIGPLSNNYNNQEDASDFYPVGTTVVTYMVSDTSGNSATCSFTVTVNDDVDPALIVPNDTIVSCDDDIMDLSVFGMATATDNCDSVSLRMSEDRSGISDVCGTGLIIRTWTAMDTSGNTTVDSQIITVQPLNPITMDDIMCPADFTYTECAFVDYDPDITGRPVIDTVGNDCFDLYVTFEDSVRDDITTLCKAIERTWTIIDSCQVVAGNGGIFTCTQIIGINDTQGPDITAPADTLFILVGEGGVCEARIDLDDAMAFDCDTMTTVTHNYAGADDPNGPNASGIFPSGITTVTYFSEDCCGNTSSVDMTVEVRDTTSPTFICRKIKYILGPDGTITSNARDHIEDGIVDDCTPDDMFTVSFSNTNRNDTTRIYECDDIAVVPVVLYVYDPFGLVDSCNAFAEVVDDDMNCDQPLTVSGTIYTSADYMISDVGVEVMNSNMPMQYSNINGEYAFDDMLIRGNKYTVQPQKDGDFVNGISLIDIIMILRHVMDEDPIDDAYAQIAADVDGNGQLNILDVLRLQEILLFDLNEIKENTSWRFVDADYIFDNNTPAVHQKFNESISYDPLTSADRAADFIGIKVGDINGTARYNVTDERIQSRSTEQAVVIGEVADENTLFSIASENVQAIDIEIATDQNISIEVLDQNVQWSSVRNDQGYRIILWTKGVLPTGQALVSINETIDNQQINGTAVVDQEELDIRYMLRADKNIHQLYQNVPNPFQDMTEVSLNVPALETDVRMDIYNVDGQLVWTRKLSGTSGYYTQRVYAEDLQGPGVYYYTVYSEHFQMTKRMILQ